MSLAEFFKTKLWPALWAALSRAFIMIGLAWLAWGVDNFPGFFANPARGGIAIIAIFQALILGWIIYRMPERPHQPHDPEHWQYSLMELTFILSAFGDRRNVLTWDENPALRWMGLGLYLLAAVYALWANLSWLNHLLRAGDNALEHPVLLSEGPFKWTRYPTLLALTFFSLGFSLAFRSWAGLACLLPLTYVIIRRAILWDQMHADRYKRSWELRSQASKRLIPFLF